MFDLFAKPLQKMKTWKSVCVCPCFVFKFETQDLKNDSIKDKQPSSNLLCRWSQGTPALEVGAVWTASITEEVNVYDKNTFVNKCDGIPNINSMAKNSNAFSY